MDDLLNRAASVLERRFLLVSLLPTLIFGSGLGLLIALSSGTMPKIVAWWGDLPASIQVAGLLGGLAVVWLAAGFLDGQLRRIVQLFEGYPLFRYIPRTAQRAVNWHLENRSAIRQSEIVAVEELPDALAGEASDVALPDGAVLSPREAATYAEEPWVLYSGPDGEVLPTRLGNILRAAEDYAQERYGADYLKVGLAWRTYVP